MVQSSQKRRLTIRIPTAVRDKPKEYILELGTLSELIQRTKTNFISPLKPGHLETARYAWDEIDEKMRHTLRDTPFDGVIHYQRIPYFDGTITLYYGIGVPIKRAAVATTDPNLEEFI